jgi:hypothetical protein
MENLYEFTMKTRTSNILYNQFLENFRDYCSKNDNDLKQKHQWLVDYIKQTKYVRVHILQSLFLSHIFFSVIVETKWLLWSLIQI